MTGDNFTEEFKYPIKIYRIWQFEFARGLEIRKLVFSVFIGTLILLTYIVVGVKSETNIIRFFINNWLVILVIVPSLITFIVFNLKYDHKKIIPFFRDRYWFYRTKHKQYEHFIEVPSNQLETELTFEPFHKEREGL